MAGPSHERVLELVARPLGFHAEVETPFGMCQQRPDGRFSCDRCGWGGCPTIVAGEVTPECPRCQAGPEVDAYAQEIGLDARLIPVRARKRLIRMSRSARAAYGAAKQRQVEAVPRNAPCPCGSGAKYKKCCGR